MDAVSPPRYSRYSGAAAAQANSQDLPAYSTLAPSPRTSRDPTEHLFHITGSSGKAWATLKVFSSAKSAKSLPTIYEKETINGSLELNVERGDSISVVTIRVTGRIITGGYSDDTVTFLDMSTQLWGKSSSENRTGSSPNKLNGRHTLPFSVSLPRTIDVGAQTFSLPETFHEKGTHVTIRYDITATLSRGKLRSDSHITTPFGYVPSTRPDAPSILRQYAYAHNLPLSGPDADPQGWYSSDHIRLQGLMKASPVDINCTFSVPKPLCYTRGSAIPCMLQLEGQNSLALDNLCSPGSIDVSLQRCVRYTSGKGKERNSVDTVGAATWWLSNGAQNTSQCRFLEGEIRLGKDLRSSSNIGSYSVSYFVVLNPFASLGMTPHDPKPLAVIPVKIATMHAKGPRAQIYAPPAYDTSRATRDLCEGLRYMNFCPVVPV